MNYIRLTEPSTRPVRYMIAKNDTIIARGMTKAVAYQIMAALMIADLNPRDHADKIKTLKEQGY